MALQQFAYKAFGLSLQSNLEIPGLTSSPNFLESFDLFVFWQVAAPIANHTSIHRELIFVSSSKSESGEPALRIWEIENGHFVELEYSDGMKFWVDKKGHNVWATWPESSSLEDAATYFLGPVLGLILRLRGFACLHASAVRIGDSAVAFVGPEGAGKSTTAAVFAKQGYPVISDDIVAIREERGGFKVLPAYPYLSLWQDSVQMLYGSETVLPSFSKTFEKKMLNPEGKSIVFEQQAIPLGAVVILGERIARDAAPFLEMLAPQEVLVRLIANSYAVHLVGKEAQAAEFATFGQLASSLPVALLHAHADSTRLPQICSLVTAWIHR